MHLFAAPVLTITDDSGRPISGERHLKAGSALKLRCEARDVVQRLNESVLWMRGDETLAEDVRFVYRGDLRILFREANAIGEMNDFEVTTKISKTW